MSVEGGVRRSLDGALGWAEDGEGLAVGNIPGSITHPCAVRQDGSRRMGRVIFFKKLLA